MTSPMMANIIKWSVLRILSFLKFESAVDSFAMQLIAALLPPLEAPSCSLHSNHHCGLITVLPYLVLYLSVCPKSASLYSKIDLWSDIWLFRWLLGEWLDELSSSSSWVHWGSQYTWKRSIFGFAMKQKANSRSSTEAELIGLDDVISKILWQKQFMKNKILHWMGISFSTTMLAQWN